jgi:hypothetical protein
MSTKNAPGTLDVFMRHAHLHGLHERELAVFRALHVAAHNLTMNLEKRNVAPYEDDTAERCKLEAALIDATNAARVMFGEP